MKHLHLLMVVMTIGLFFYNSVAILTSRPLGRTLKAVSHVIYGLLLISGLSLFYDLWQLKGQIGVQYWPMAKLSLLVCVVALLIVANKKAEHKKTMVIWAWVLTVTILALAVTKPI